MGTDTDLLTEMNDTTTLPNTVTKLLNKFSFELYCSSGIDVDFRRANRRRIIELRNDKQDEFCQGYFLPKLYFSFPS